MKYIKDLLFAVASVLLASIAVVAVGVLFDGTMSKLSAAATVFILLVIWKKLRPPTPDKVLHPVGKCDCGAIAPVWQFGKSRMCQMCMAQCINEQCVVLLPYNNKPIEAYCAAYGLVEELEILKAIISELGYTATYTYEYMYECGPGVRVCVPYEGVTPRGTCVQLDKFSQCLFDKDIANLPTFQIRLRFE